MLSLCLKLNDLIDWDIMGDTANDDLVGGSSLTFD